MTYVITKEFRFEAAHRLVCGYQGKCSNIHGHSWVVRVSVSSDTLDEFGFVVDFSSLKPIKRWIDECLDHAMLVAREDGAMRQFLLMMNQRHFVMEGNPTSENLAAEIMKKGIELGFNVTEVEINETCTSSCKLKS